MHHVCSAALLPHVEVLRVKKFVWSRPPCCQPSGEVCDKETPISPRYSFGVKHQKKLSSKNADLENADLVGNRGFRFRKVCTPGPHVYWYLGFGGGICIYTRASPLPYPIPQLQLQVEVMLPGPQKAHMPKKRLPPKGRLTPKIEPTPRLSCSPQLAYPMAVSQPSVLSTSAPVKLAREQE